MLERFRRSFPGRCLARYDQINGAQQAGLIALSALLGLVPIILMLVALGHNAGAWSIRLDDALIRKLDLTGPAVKAVHGALDTTGRSARSITVVAILGGGSTLIGFNGSIWRVFNATLATSRLPGIRASIRSAIWLLFTCVMIVIIQVVGKGTRIFSGTFLHHPARDAVRIIGASVIWLLSPRILVNRSIPLRKLLPGAAVGGALTGLVIIFSGLYVPGLLSSYAVPFGAFGVAIAVGFWLWTIAGIIVLSAVVMAELAQLDPDDPSVIDSSSGGEVRTVDDGAVALAG